MRVQLLTKTENMFTAIWNIWKASRTNEKINFTVLKHCSPPLQEEIKALFFRIMEEDIPIIEMVEFIFLLEDIPISLREQIVRHRLGIKFDDKIGLDIVPDLLDSTFWCQSMRVMNMTDFNYFVPKSIADAALIKTGPEKIPLAVYQNLMAECSRVYAQLIEIGVPMEDARQVIPLGATHRMVWKLSLTAIKHICSKRSCWIAQLGMWKPIIEGMIHELTEIDKRFHSLVSPPCIQRGKFQGCKFCEHNVKRVLGEGEEMPPCPLYLHNHKEEALKQKNAKWIQTPVTGFWVTRDRNLSEEMKMEQMKKDYQHLWNRKVTTGESL